MNCNSVNKKIESITMTLQLQCKNREDSNKSGLNAWPLFYQIKSVQVPAATALNFYPNRPKIKIW